MRFKYQVVAQWDARSGMYEAHVPALSLSAVMFLPSLPRTSHADSMSGAVELAVAQAKVFLRELNKLNILPPPADVGHTDPAEYSYGSEDLGKMVL